MLRVLLVEDSPTDALLVRLELERTFGEVLLERVDGAVSFEAALRSGKWDVVLADHNLPGFSSFGALELVRRSGLDLPFVVVSGAMGEHLAVEAMKAGAHDFVTKQSPSRLGPAVERELREAGVRRQRARAEELLRHTQQRLAAVLESTQDRVFAFDEELRVTAVYGAWLRAESRQLAQLLGHPVAEVFGAEAAAPVERYRRALAGDNAVFEWSREQGGQVRHFQTSLSPLLGDDERVRGGVGIVRDITRLREMEGQLVMADRLVSVGTLAASVAHEINNPLASILANLGLALEQVRAAPAACGALLEPLSDAKEASERVRDIVKDLRILSRADEQRIGAVDVARVLESALRLAWNEVRHRARVQKELGETPPVRASEARLGQVFLNLLVNAAQAIPEGNAAGNRITLRTRALPAGEVAVEVEDTGCGMTPEVRARLFAPFFTTKPPGLGTGLGLSISRRIVDELGGRIEVESEPRRGSVFRVILPVEPVEPVEPAARAAAPAPAPARRGRVLVVDDDEHVREAMRRVLSARHEVVLADGPTAVARVEAGERFDLVLCDLMMPVMTGMDVHARLVARAPALAARMVFVSGGAFTPAAREFLERTGARLVHKPFEPDELRRIVNEALT